MGCVLCTLCASFIPTPSVCSVLSGKSIKIIKIRELDEDPGVTDYEVSFLKLLDQLTNGTQVKVNDTGTCWVCIHVVWCEVRWTCGYVGMRKGSRIVLENDESLSLSINLSDVLTAARFEWTRRTYTRDDHLS
jgi:hypothetical protein